MGAISYALLYLATALGAVGLMAYGWKRRYFRAGIPFFLVMAALAFWSFSHALGIADPTRNGTLIWMQVQYLGIVLIGPFWLVFALAYADRWRAWPQSRRIALFVPSFLSMLASASNAWHGLWWRNVSVATGGSFTSMQVVAGPLLWAHQIFHISCLLVAFWFFLQIAMETPPGFRRQARLAIYGALLPVLGVLLHSLNARMLGFDDMAPFFFLASGITIFYASMRYHLLSLQPIAEREVLESVPDGIIVLDRRGMLVSFNPSAQRLLALPQPLQIGQALLPLQHSPLQFELIAMLDASDTAQVHQITYAGPGGLQGIEVRLRPLREASGRPIGTLLVLHDVSEQVRMQKTVKQRFAEISLINYIARTANAAQETEAVIRLMAGPIVDLLPWERVFIALDADGALELAIDRVRDIAGKPGKIPPTPQNLAPLAELLAAGRSRVFQREGNHDDAINRLMIECELHTLVIVPMIRHEARLGLFCAGSSRLADVDTDTVRLLATLSEMLAETIVRTRLYEEARQISKLKTAFLATVSHELRTPLTSIVGYNDMLRRGIYGALPERIANPIDMINQSSQVLLRLINDMLDFSKMEAGYFTMDLYPVDVRSAVINVSRGMATMAEERGLQLAVDLPDLLPPAMANGMRLEQVLGKLVTNAVKFTDQGCVMIRVHMYGDHLRLSVCDTGIGIPAWAQPTIFNEFRRIENAHTRRYGGAGLSLAISRRLIELMGGKISLESSEGVGSSFHCDLRIAEQLQERAVGE
jgi:PAS domain S-box-containing protein